MKALAIKVEGRVQGVGFRYFVQTAAAKHQITGWVRNTSDGNVEIEAEGAETDLDAFIRDVQQGSPFSRVAFVQVSELPSLPHYDKFQIKY